MKKHNTIFWICFITSTVLIVAGFLLPPMGIIDSSVLLGVGELFAFGTLYELPNIIKNGKITLKKGDTEIEVDPED